MGEIEIDINGLHLDEIKLKHDASENVPRFYCSGGVPSLGIWEWNEDIHGVLASSEVFPTSDIM